MKQFYLPLLLVCFATFSSAQIKLFTNEEEVYTQEDDSEKESWYIDPTIDLDELIVYDDVQKVTFYSSIDTLEIDFIDSNIVDFPIYFNQDTAWTRVRRTISYKRLLQMEGGYSNKNYSRLPSIHYQDKSAKELEEIRLTFNLDSVAGIGDEISQQVEIMHWVHELITHNGQLPNPHKRNALYFYNTCANGKGTLNCRGLSIFLNECYLAMGWKSRMVSCLPKDSLDPDNHVINAVYSTQLNKWLWMDPTWDTYITDEDGDLLSIAEVRQGIVEGKKMFTKANANWNHKVEMNTDDYIYRYMAKNLYRIECPISNEFGYESRSLKTLKYILLVGEGDHYSNQLTSKRKGLLGRRKYYITTNSELFWSL